MKRFYRNTFGVTAAAFGITAIAGVTVKTGLIPDFMQQAALLWQQEFLGNSVLSYLVAIATILIGFLTTKTFVPIAIKRLKQWAGLTKTDFDDTLIRFLDRITIPILYFGVLYISLKGLVLHPTLGRSLDIFGIVCLTFAGIRCANLLTESAFRFYWRKHQDSDSQIQEEGMHLVLPSLTVIVWTIGIVFLLGNLGFDISAVIASLGIGGVAIALASKSVLEDLFSYYAILLDRPFEIGDVIAVGEFMGSVESVGIKTTRIKSSSGEQLIFSNRDITSSRLKNFKRMARRRAIFKISVMPNTPLEKLQEIPLLIQNIITGIDHTQFERSHFANYGESSLNFETVYYVLSSDYNLYMDIQQEINFKIKQIFEQQSIQFPYPTPNLPLNPSSDQGT